MHDTIHALRCDLLLLQVIQTGGSGPVSLCIFFVCFHATSLESSRFRKNHLCPVCNKNQTVDAQILTFLAKIFNDFTATYGSKITSQFSPELPTNRCSFLVKQPCDIFPGPLFFKGRNTLVLPCISYGFATIKLLFLNLTCIAVAIAFLN